MIISGLFGVNSGTIQDVVVSSGGIQGGEHIGGIVGLNYGNIINCGNDNIVTGNKGVGGICGCSIGGKISGCFNNKNITGNGAHDESHAGGIAGSGSKGMKISNCYNKGNIDAKMTYSGGIVGAFSLRETEKMTVENCYSVGEISADWSARRLNRMWTYLCGNYKLLLLK